MAESAVIQPQSVGGASVHDRWRRLRRGAWLLSRSSSSMLGVALVGLFFFLAAFGPDRPLPW